MAKDDKNVKTEEVAPEPASLLEDTLVGNEGVLLYQCPGEQKFGPGHMGNTVHVKTQADLDACLADGWFRTLPEAVKAFYPDTKKPAAKPGIPTPKLASGL